MIPGGILTTNSAFGGQVAGTHDGLLIENDSVLRTQLHPAVRQDIDEALAASREPRPASAAELLNSPQGVDIAAEVRATSMTVQEEIKAKRFAGDGSALTGVVAADIAGGVINRRHLDASILEALDRPVAQPMMIPGGILTSNSAFGGQVTGTVGSLTIADGSVEGRQIADGTIAVTDVDLRAFDQRYALREELIAILPSIASQPDATAEVLDNPQGVDIAGEIRAPSMAVQGEIKARRFAGNGSALTGVVAADIAEGVIGGRHLDKDLQDFIVDAAAPRPAAVEDGSITREKMAPELVALLDRSPPQPVLIRDEEIADDAAIDPLKIAGRAITARDSVRGVIEGTLDNLTYRNESVTGAALAKATINLEHLGPDILREFQQVRPAPESLDTLRVDGALTAGTITGRGTGLSEIPFSAIDIPRNSVTGEIIAPAAIDLAHLAPGIRSKLDREPPRLDALSSLAIRGPVTAESFAGDGSELTGLQFSALTIPDAAVNGRMIRNASITPDHLAFVLPRPDAVPAWLLGGQDSGSVEPLVLGTKNRAAVHLIAGDSVGLRIEPSSRSPRIIGGHAANQIAPGVSGAVIAGGGTANAENRATRDFATVGGGARNLADHEYATVAGGFGNISRGFDAAIGGGQDNRAGGSGAVVAGGFTNRASGSFSSVLGGAANRADGNVAAVGGGYGNQSRGSHATVPGGSLNEASGDYSFAAGRRAKAEHAGSFVWADATDRDAKTTGNNQFVVRASGGVTLYAAPDSERGVRLPPGSGSWSSLSDAGAKKGHQPVDSRAVLEALAAMPVTTWTYRGQPDHVRHMGPTAQDFSTALGLGESDTHIATIDAQGAALAAIQGLHEIVQEKAARIAALEDRNRSLAARLKALESRLPMADSSPDAQ